MQWNSQDFQFVNNSNCDIRLIVTANDGKLTCTVEAKEDIKPKKVDIKIKKDGKTYDVELGAIIWVETKNYQK